MCRNVDVQSIHVFNDISIQNALKFNINEIQQLLFTYLAYAFSTRDTQNSSGSDE